MRILRWLPFALLVGLALWYGLRLGTQWRDRTETEAIGAVAARYVREVEGARAADCAAVPGKGAVWLVVACGRQDRLRVYRVDRRGRIVEQGGGGA